MSAFALLLGQADIKRQGMIDVVGFDAGAPVVMADFAR